MSAELGMFIVTDVELSWEFPESSKASIETGYRTLATNGINAIVARMKDVGQANVLYAYKEVDLKVSDNWDLEKFNKADYWQVGRMWGVFTLYVLGCKSEQLGF